ncbi:GNAT family N-acetyltransferase [Verrucomicrobiota bacterium sgz303538]
MADLQLLEFSPADQDLLDEVGRLRVRAWETEAPEAAEMSTWLDTFDADARHWVVLRDDVPVASARLSVHSQIGEVPDSESYAGLFPETLSSPIGSMNRLVVHPSARGLGLSKQLDLIRLRTAKEMGCRSVILSTASGPKRVKQLVGWGFEMLGYGPRFANPPLCYLTPPAVLIRKFH